MIIRVAVGSTNPCKIEAVRQAFTDMFHRQQHHNNAEIVISSHDAKSGVSDQPMGDTETKEGAYNRAIAALSSLSLERRTDNNNDDQSSFPELTMEFAVGLEGGLEKSIHPQTNEMELYCMAWMAVIGKTRDDCSIHANAPSSNTEMKMYTSYAKTATFILPPKITELVLEKNMELGHADDQVFDRVNSKHGGGTVGVLTNGEIDRKDYYVHALKMALIPWMKSELYFQK